MCRTTAVTFCSYSSTSRVTPSSAKRWPQAHCPEYRTGLLGLRAACWREAGGRVLTPHLCHENMRNTRTNPKAKKICPLSAAVWRATPTIKSFRFNRLRKPSCEGILIARAHEVREAGKTRCLVVLSRGPNCILPSERSDATATTTNIARDVLQVDHALLHLRRSPLPQSTPPLDEHRAC